ncbi:zonadhesin-like [Bolinopsis microptera]|uniref:zonadhesin-like n=1 Tax=Bolinopsis microptera TaxID=2820187 RepID=UPI003078D5C3
MFWITIVLAVTRLLYVSALECYHMNKYGASKLIICRGYCASISAVVANNNLAEVNYCVPERRCLAELDSRQLTDMGSLICRGLIESANPGAITRCRAAVCQSDGCNNYNFRSDPEMNDCSLHQCSNAACHNPEELITTIAPPISSTYATVSTPLRTDDQKIITDEPAPSTLGSSDGQPATEKANPEFETTGATTSGNEITTKAPVVTSEAKIETEKPSTTTAPSTSPTEKPATDPATDPKQPTTVKEEIPVPNTTMTEEPEVITEKESPTTPENEPTTAKPETVVPVEEEAVTVEEEAVTVEEEAVTVEEEAVTDEPASVTDAPEDLTDEEPTLDDFGTITRGPPLVPTDFKETGSVTSYPPTMAEVTTDGASTTEEVVIESTDFSEVITVDVELGAITDDQSTTDVVDITRTPYLSSKFKNFIGSSQPENGYISNNSIEEDVEITNRDTVKSSGISGVSASYLSLSIILLASAVIL